MQNSLKIESKIKISSKDGKNYTCDTILLKEINASNFDLYVKLENILSKIMLDVSKLPITDSDKKVDPPNKKNVLDARNLSTTDSDKEVDPPNTKNVWTEMFASPIKPFSTDYIIELRDLLFKNNLIFCVVKEDEFYPAVNYLDQISSIKDIYKIMGGYLDSFFTL